MKIGVIGTGRLGICFSLILSKYLEEVNVYDKNLEYLKLIDEKQFNSPEPYVNELINENKNLNFCYNLSELIESSEIIYTFVDTPSNQDGTYDISNLQNVIEDCLLEDSFKEKVFVIGCTVNPGDSQNISNRLSSNNIETFYNPEFIAQGSIVDDLENADLVLIGGKKNKNSEDLVSIYEKFMKKTPNFSILSYTSAEITKIAINSFLNTKITFANMIGDILIKSNKEDEISNVLQTIASDKRIGNKYFNFGLGFGGPCLPRDNIALIKYAENLNLDLDLLSKVDEHNKKHRKVIADFVISQNKENYPFFMEGIGFKKGSDILTESTRLYLLEDLLSCSKKVYVESIFESNFKILNKLSKNNENLTIVDTKDDIKEEVYEIIY